VAEQDEVAGHSQDLLQAILQAAVVNPARAALSGHRGRTLRYRDLAVAVVATAKGLRSNGFLTGDRLLFGVRPDPGGVVLALAVVAAGGCVVFIEPGSNSDDFAFRAAQTGATWMAAESEVYAAGPIRPLRFLTRGTERPDYGDLGIRTLRAGPWLPGVPRGTLSFAALRKARGSADEEPLPGLRADPAAEAAVLFTAGTSDGPRGVVHTRGSLGSALSGLAARHQIDHRATVYTDQLMLGLPALTSGAHWRLPAPGLVPRVDPARFAKSMGGATHAFLFPADLAAVLTAISEHLAPKPADLQQIVAGGAPVLPPLVGRMQAVLPDVRLLTIYGMTEILPIAIAEGADKLTADPDGDLVGELQPGVEARIAEDSELIVSGPSLAKGYLGQPPLTEHATGDLAVLRGRTVVLMGRKQDMIRRGGAQIYPGPYESAIEALPGVGHAAMVGIPNEIGDERAVLVLQPAGQPVNDRPLAGEPKQSNSRDDRPPDPTQAVVLLHHPLAMTVAPMLPEVIDPIALPDQIVVLSAIPVAGRGGRADRVALRRLLADLPPEDGDLLSR
jgi:acyl-CoA synthetase (AMP-forming)/AMP-acid ligase II